VLKVASGEKHLSSEERRACVAVCEHIVNHLILMRMGAEYVRRDRENASTAPSQSPPDCGKKS
jgi:hypothetical protein